jgi:carbon monoxide dehydrogenase subunit G
MTVRTCFALLGLSLVVCTLGDVAPRTAAAREAAAREFTPAEAARLRAGGLVVRREQVTRQGAHLIGGFSWQRVDADVDAVWKTMTDTRAYPQFLPAVTSVTRKEKVGSERRLHIQHKTLLVETGYCVLVRSDPAQHAFTFRLDRTRDAAINDAWGELRVTAYEGGSSVVSLAIMADLGSGLIARLVRSQVHQWMLRIPEQLARHLAREKRKRS